MRAVIQRVSAGSVKIEAPEHYEEIGKGMVILLGVKIGDTDGDAIYLADKCCNLRIFEDSNDKMNISLKDINGEALVISQFTLFGDTRKGNRPSFSEAAEPESANQLYEKFIEQMKKNLSNEKVKKGIFGAMMEVKIINTGPVTLIVESKG
ncbi:MAG: D-tyrosyl-tRNA(Tyr) deacylase [Melioribacteraceae bacterium]|nr:D-tyrosyl-tRNA(Tyr) deacylase [Melioribacteraceae bacterium]